MTADDLDRFTKELTRLSELYDKPMTESLQALYFEALQGYEIASVVAAMRAHVVQPERGRWFPKPADLISLLDGAPEEQALEAWSDVIAAWTSTGYYGVPEFQDPSITSALTRMGGWQSFCERYKIIRNESFLREEFCQRYQGAERRASTQRALPGGERKALNE
ncbi:MAG: DUF6475 domain-containing protein [Dehalococcoidia bacterium]|nr:DUF6475 domain-containing protein [Dehalococcoidia bacterium]